MGETTWKHFKTETLPNGATYYTGEIEYEDHFTVKKHDAESIVFVLNGATSKPIKVVHDHGWAWKAQKTQIKTMYSIEELLSQLKDSFWSNYTYNMACKYCKP